jgi:hypothetical protein
MKYTGTIKGGVVVLEKGAELADGTRVQVEPLEEPPDQPTLGEIFKDFIGKAVGLPPDLAENHDHYLYGVPKKSGS